MKTITAAVRAKQGGLKLVEMCELIKMPRQTVYDTFKRDPAHFDELLIKAMRADCEKKIAELNNNNECE